MNNLGKKGENLAKDYLKKNAYSIIAENYHSKLGEIDIIAIKNDFIIFVEVKARKNSSKDDILNSVSQSKQKKIKLTAEIFLSKNQNYQNFFLRFDIISLKQNVLTHYENVF